MKQFEGRKIRDQILADLAVKIKTRNQEPTLAVILVGFDPVSLAYVNLKEKIAKKIGIKVNLFHLSKTTATKEVISIIDKLNTNEEISGIMVQIPVPAGLDRDKIIKSIRPDKDVDGLRYCLGLDSDFLPPVIVAIEKAIKLSAINLKKSKVVLVGHGFLVGKPLERYLKDRTKELVIADTKISDIQTLTNSADLIISATGQAGLIKLEMIKEGVVLIDAGTSEVGGKMTGDIDPSAYEKASFYTPVPGGIGPVTVAMLLKNIVYKSQTQ